MVEQGNNKSQSLLKSELYWGFEIHKKQMMLNPQRSVNI